MIKVHSVTKRFGDLTAVDSVSFEVHSGEVLGFLGPNGAGKSTTMKMILGFLQPSRGEIQVCGHEVKQNAQAAQKETGYMPENAPLYEEMYVREFLEFIAGMREIPREEAASKVDWVVQTCTLGAVEYQKIETLSKGLQEAGGFSPSLDSQPQGTDSRRAHRWSRPQSKTRCSSLNKRFSQEEVHSHLHPYSGRSGGDLRSLYYYWTGEKGF